MVLRPERLKQARDWAGLSQPQLAKRLGVTQQAVSGWETGARLPDSKMLPRIASVLGVSVDWLLGKADHPFPTPHHEPSHKGLIAIPVLGVIHAGDPAWAQQEPEGWIDAPADILAGKGEYFALRVKGDCFSVGKNPIHDGYIVLVRRQPTVENGEIAVVYWPDQEEAVLRRVERRDGQIILRADNPAYPVEVVRNKDLTILGKVVGFFGRPSGPKDVA